jgi:DNA-3-methyladenine glycosylase
VPLFGRPGTAYVYFSYGMHALLNVVCERAGVGAAVLIRALEPIDGIGLMRERRKLDDIRKLCSGPGKLTSALAIDGTHDRHPLDQPPFLMAEAMRAPVIVTGPRIGISRDVDRPWRFGLSGTPFVSRPFR